MSNTSFKISLAHDSFTQLGGAERVVEAVHELYPKSLVYTTVVDEKVKSLFPGWDFKVSILQKLYNHYPHFQYLFPFVPVALRFMYPEPTDILWSSSSSYIKGMPKPGGAYHICYCHTPTRFIWSDADYAANEIPAVLRPLARLYFIWLRSWDKRAANQVDYFIANSKEVQGRIKKYYGRDSEVIYPFLDINFWKPTRPKQDYFLIAGRLQPHKNNEVVIQLFNTLGLPLHVVGTGRQEHYLRSIAKSNITFLGRVSDEQLRDEYSGAKAFIYPQLEDLGMMPLEAAACGTPTIGLGQGGSLETIVSGVTGDHFSEATEAAIKEKVVNWDSAKYEVTALQNHAKQFSKEIFQTKIRNFIETVASKKGMHQ